MAVPFWAKNEATQMVLILREPYLAPKMDVLFWAQNLTPQIALTFWESYLAPKINSNFVPTSQKS